ncbi:hypothetical protein ABT143_17265 [Streptomyces sp. NPDC002033]|uniref:hypothetical protein n=1 Tax=unclassified Streptomyces TaxID=2593676 RepID=UPI0033233589
MSSGERVVFEPAWEDNPTWGGSELFEDLAVAQRFAAEAYVDEQDEVFDRHEDGPGELVWVAAGGSWELTDGGRVTPVSVESRPVRTVSSTGGSMATAEVLELAHEFRVPVPDIGLGGYGEIVVQRDRAGTDRWAVTDGAVTGLRTWTESAAGADWQYVSDVGRQAAFRHTLSEALRLAKTVAGVEAERYRARVTPEEPGGQSPAP